MKYQILTNVICLQDADEVISDINRNHAKFVEDKKVKIENVCQNISTQLKNQIMESCMRNDNVIGQLETAVGEINKFFDEDVQRDIPTGLYHV